MHCKCAKPSRYLCASCGEYSACSEDHMQALWHSHRQICLGANVNALLQPALKFRSLFKFHYYNLKIMTKQKKAVMTMYLRDWKFLCQKKIGEEYGTEIIDYCDYLFTFQHRYKGNQFIDTFLLVAKTDIPNRYHIELVCSRPIYDANGDKLDLRLGKILHGLFLNWLHDRDPDAQVELDAARAELIPYYGPFGYRVGASCKDHTIFRVKDGTIRMIMCSIGDSPLFANLNEDIENAEELIKQRVLTKNDKIAVLGLDSAPADYSASSEETASAAEYSEGFSPEETAGTGYGCVIS
jgi:hypothetical protein